VVVLAGLPTPAAAFPPNGGTETSTGTAPADGGALVTHTDEIPADATQGSFSVQPLPGTDPHDFDGLTAALVETFPHLSKVSKHSLAVLACVLLSYLPYDSVPRDEPITYTQVNYQLLLLNICLRMALSIPNTPGRAHDRAGAAAAGACGRIARSVPVRITRTRSGYTGVVDGNLQAPPSRPGLAVTCRRAGKGLLLSVRPKKRGQTLRQAGSPELGIAYTNTSSKPVGIRTTFKAN
jgi:hypothetical protein